MDFANNKFTILYWSISRRLSAPFVLSIYDHQNEVAHTIGVHLKFSTNLRNPLFSGEGGDQTLKCVKKYFTLTAYDKARFTTLIRWKVRVNAGVIRHPVSMHVKLSFNNNKVF